jgi:uncharacterized membrane protein (DUF2068 family)
MQKRTPPHEALFHKPGKRMPVHNSVRVIALFEAAKGALVIVTGLGALSLIHQDAPKYAALLVHHLHLNPAKHYPQIFIDAAAHLTDTRLLTLATMAAAYGLIRIVEAYGLWQARRWAEWFAAVSGGIYIPFEIYEFIKGDTWLSAGAFAVNVLVVALMVKELYRGHAVTGSPTSPTR